VADNRRSTRPYRRARQALRDQRNPCHICSRPIDYTLPHTHPMSFVADHLQPLAHGGHYAAATNLAAAHKLCNGRRGTRDLADVVAIPPPSRAW
jgi:5-methylcytosine-specific restriction endonuclease McrA